MKIGPRVMLHLLLCFAPKALVAQALSVAEQYLFAQANAERADRGLPLLRWDAALYRAAAAHASEMAQRRSISHQYPGEPELAFRGKNAGAQFSMIAENVAEAPTAVRIHDAWMNSPGHRANLLDPEANAVAVSVLQQDGQLYAVQDFERSVMALSLAEQEQQVAVLVSAVIPVQVRSTDDARRTCSMESGFAGTRRPVFLMRYTAGEISQLPELLKSRLVTGKTHAVAVGACTPKGRQAFSAYSIVVLLYP